MEVFDDNCCFACGELNPDGLGLKFEQREGVVVAEAQVPPRLQGWKGVAHGGIVGLILDEAMAYAATYAGAPGVTGKFEVRLRRPLPIGERVRAVGRVESIRGSRVLASARIARLSDGELIAEATGLLVGASMESVRAARFASPEAGTMTAGGG